MLLSYWCQREACTRCQTAECQHHCHRESHEGRADRPGRDLDSGNRLRGRERPGPGDGMALLRQGGGPAATRAEPGHHTSGIPVPYAATPPPASPQPTRDRGPGLSPARDPRRDLARAAAAIWDLYRDAARAHPHTHWSAFHSWPAEHSPTPAAHAHADFNRRRLEWWGLIPSNPGSDPHLMDQSSYSDAVGSWHRWTAEHTAELLTDAIAHACAHVANVTIHECVGEVARLRAELDRYQGRAVHHCTEAQMQDAAVTLALDAAPGTILRATDTGLEWVFRDGTWAERGRR